MEPIFRTTMKWTIEEYKKFYRAILREYSVAGFILGIILIDIIVFIIGIVIQKYYILIVVISSLILFPIYFYIVMKSEIEKEYNSSNVINNVESEFMFYEDYFIEKTKFGETKVEYTILYKIIETKDNMYLMLGKNQGYALIKEKMPKELKEFIISKKKLK